MGVQYRNGKYFGGGSGGDGLIPISQEEFNKLTPEERDNHKSYFIYDAIAQTPSGTHVGIRYYPHQEDFDALSEAEKAAIPDLVITGGKRDALSARDVQYKEGTVEAALDKLSVNPLEWKLAGSVTGTSDEITLPDEYTELLIDLGSDTMIIPKNLLTDTAKEFVHYSMVFRDINTPYWGSIVFLASKTMVKVGYCVGGYGLYGSGWFGKSDNSATTTITVYYR